MNKLLVCIEENINTHINGYISVISNKYNINIDELKQLWNSPAITPSIPVSSVSSVSNSPKSVKSLPKTKTPKEKNENKCSYKFTKGKQQGEICSGGVKGDSQYCSKHVKFEDIGQKDKKTLLPITTEKKSVDRLVRLNKEINKWWHVESKLVFKSNKEKIVIGTYRDNIYNDLCDEDIEDCNKYGFRYEIPEKVKDVIPEKVKVEIPKKIEKKIEKISITQQINTHAKNVEDVISDMLEDTHLDSDKDSDNDSNIEEELEVEEELDEEY
jgi:hypothetical protein